ncbi:bifunctional protein-disulfide isomerase/oxidoreductase DsbC [Pasteurella multocida]|uniref:bifunctional protein-disulfide isomerase/oxidoreductase DsbC n=1 Tax=Pasteurella multocida TaxID=747 RepID=UPI002025B3A2|nr:bifunctional protein-disulfide isomerase/oxidoreductase DsbC [Pasteurella multocida]MDT8766768.1 bifunctional protein-disulfide isomerase/oxidoreductase DsbC [Pasteurella multocida]URJ86899.1 bifunctional protein-disulfide isomerase/oxidoreductase DsbC [Pasteurella multocida]URJ88886.1 bifunctional protein-disulfide isomerase/oxidoreductase DsbC [Pasteurella multocida]HDR0619145.1 bifunctional protein-disulfide isomerase/oxidoreductase DsbC [Pasteurella multocida]
MKKILSTLLMLGMSSLTFANSQHVVEQLQKMGLSGVEVSDSPVKGIKTAVTDNGIFYITEDAKYILDGKLYALSEKGLRDVSSSLLLDKLTAYKNEMVVYPAKDEKHVITVFMDTSCHYCKVLHKQIKEYNDLGITVRYLAFPRGGVQSKTAREMEAIFTAQDPQFALTEAINGHPPKTLKDANITKKHYQLGLQFGVNGTPSIVTEKGELIGGYLKPADLLSELAQ